MNGTTINSRGNSNKERERLDGTWKSPLLNGMFLLVTVKVGGGEGDGRPQCSQLEQSDVMLAALTYCILTLKLWSCVSQFSSIYVSIGILIARLFSRFPIQNPCVCVWWGSVFNEMRGSFSSLLCRTNPPSVSSPSSSDHLFVHTVVSLAFPLSTPFPMKPLVQTE